MKNLTWQNPEQLFVAQELTNKVKSKCCGIKDYHKLLSVGEIAKATVKYPVAKLGILVCRHRIVLLLQFYHNIIPCLRIFCYANLQLL